MGCLARSLSSHSPLRPLANPPAPLLSLITGRGHYSRLGKSASRARRTAAPRPVTASNYCYIPASKSGSLCDRRKLLDISSGSSLLSSSVRSSAQHTRDRDCKSTTLHSTSYYYSYSYNQSQVLHTTSSKLLTFEAPSFFKALGVSVSRLPHRVELQSGISATVVTAAVGVALSLAGFFVLWGSSSTSSHNDTAAPAPAAAGASTATNSADSSGPGPYIYYYGEPIDLSQYSAGMSLEASTGRLGNLTAEQEEKLKEVWWALAKICGVVQRTSMDDAIADTASTQSPASTKNEKSKKRFGSVLGRGKKEKVLDDGASGYSVATNAGEDKYGQTKEFQRALAEMKPEEIREWFWSFQKADDPDALLLRFLRARKWNVQNALVMMVSTVRWRGSDIHLDDDLMIKGEQWFADAEAHGTGADKKMGEDFMRQLRMGKSFVHGTDNDGRPMCFIRARLHKGGAQSAESLEKLTLHTIETARVMLKPPVETASLVFDLTGFGLANMDYTPVKFMVKVFEANYPESLGHIFVYKAPWVFSGIWKIIKGWLDPVVASKVHFLNNAKEMSEFVPPAHIPKDLGGEEDWEYEYIEPVPGENKLMEDHATRDKLWEERWKIIDQYEKATQEWCEGKGGSEILAFRTELAGQLRDNYWKMDPYIRGKSLYDRQGIITSPEGKINLYPKSLPDWVTGGVAPTTNGVSHHGPAASVMTTGTLDEFVDALEYQ